jgi:hypothetical protein
VDYNTIVLKGEGHVEEGKLTSDYGYLGDPYAYPGMAVKKNADSEFEVGIGSTDGAAGVVRIVIEDYLLGKTITDPYAEGSTARVYIPQPGDELLVLVKTGENLAIGDTLICESASGEWIKTTGSPKMIPFEVQESTDGALAESSLVRVKRI